MRLLHTADWHLGRTLEGRNRLNEQAQFLDQLCDIVDEYRIDVVLIAGDVFDTVNPPAAAEQLYYETLARFSAKQCTTVAIAGNHDSPERLSAPVPLAAKHNIHLVGFPKQMKTNCLTLHVPEYNYPLIIAALPYPSEARLNEVLTDETDEKALQKAYSERIAHVFSLMAESFRPDAIRLAMSHLFVMGGLESDSERPIQLGAASAVHPEALPSAAQYVALGHLHRPQKVSGASTPTRYSGSPLAYSFSEAGQTKSVVIVDINPERITSLEVVPLSAGKPLTRWHATEGLKQVISWCQEGRDANAWIDLEIHLDAPLTGDQIQHLRSMHDGFIHIRPILAVQHETAATSEGRHRLPPDELFRRFYVSHQGQEPPEELLKLFVELLTNVDDDQTEATP